MPKSPKNPRKRSKSVLMASWAALGFSFLAFFGLTDLFAKNSTTTQSTASGAITSGAGSSDTSPSVNGFATPPDVSGGGSSGSSNGGSNFGGGGLQSPSQQSGGFNFRSGAS